jgi:hypothetical protein
MISLSKQFLFLHVPKTGGNSLQSILLPYSDERLSKGGPLLDGNDRFELRHDELGLSKHATLEDYRVRLPREIFDPLFKFAVMRNPWDRMISYYFSPHRGMVDWDRDEFLKLLSWVPPLRHFVLPQTLWVKLRARAECATGRPGASLSRMVQLLRFEHLREDFGIVCDRLQLELDPLPHRNASNREHYSVYYDDELIEQVRRRHLEEITLGGYRFERQ